MPTYITLFRWTQKGIENVKDSPARLDAAKKATAAAGGRVIAFYLTTGQYDAVAISELPNDEAMAKFALAGASQRICSLGNAEGVHRGRIPEDHRLLALNRTKRARSQRAAGNSRSRFPWSRHS